jgi:hypothetical protein
MSHAAESEGADRTEEESLASASASATDLHAVSLGKDDDDEDDDRNTHHPTANTTDRTVPKIIQQFEHPEALPFAAAAASSAPANGIPGGSHAGPKTPSATASKKRGLGGLFRKWTGTTTGKSGRMGWGGRMPIHVSHT